jgi:hypothetical protein
MSQGLYCSKKRIGCRKIFLNSLLPEPAELKRLVLLTSRVFSMPHTV